MYVLSESAFVVGIGGNLRTISLWTLAVEIVWQDALCVCYSALCQEEHRAWCASSKVLWAPGDSAGSWLTGQSPGAQGHTEGGTNQHGAKRAAERVGHAHLSWCHRLLDLQKKCEQLLASDSLGICIAEICNSVVEAFALHTKYLNTDKWYNPKGPVTVSDLVLVAESEELGTHLWAC